MNKDLKSHSILMFSGQGSQKVDMGRYYFDNFKISSEILEKASDISGYNLKKIILDEESINNTKYSQIIISTVSIAMLEAFKKELGFFSINEISSCVIGHSLGEYSALYASEVISFEDNIKLLKERSLLMEKACQMNPGAMVALIYSDINDVYNLLDDIKKNHPNKVICLANDNCEGQIVMSGHDECINYAIQNYKNFAEIKKAIKLTVSGAFHSSLMKYAQDGMSDLINNTNFKNPIVPIYQNYSAKKESDITIIKSNLINQIANTVKFRESLHNLKNEGIVKNFIEISYGSVISGMVKKTIVSEDIKIIGSSSNLSDLITFFSI